MFRNFKEKSITEKLTRILGIPVAIITIALGINTLFFSHEELPKKDIQNSGDNSTIVTGNGNTFNNNTYNTIETNNNSKKKLTIKYSNKDYDTIKNTKVNSINNDKIRIAILPFENITNNKEYEWLSKGIAESLLTNLSKINKFKIIEGTLRDKVLEEINFQNGKYVDIKSAVKIGKMLGTKEILIGSYQIINQKIKITSRIVDVENGIIVQNSTFEYEDTISDLFKMQKNYSEYFLDKIN